MGSRRTLLKGQQRQKSFVFEVSPGTLQLSSALHSQFLGIAGFFSDKLNYPYMALEKYGSAGIYRALCGQP